MRDALHSSDSEDDGTKQRKKYRTESEAAKQKALGEEYEPLSRLIKVVKNRILELAKLNSEQTVQLVETFLNDDSF